ncbi:hypothetical protein LOCC1_G001881 [Lachnellula occidentalis]|uniref:Uncharacterized protein n=1 Tax=Lachnellula occidentalis TaxID=215460 RepID=A0A8H8S701_9HELO|nr:hypothetical protein LOCC1_G001881 [Lachnellula occidentalis]
MARLLNDDTTKAALEHRFRPIKREAADMLAVIAREYGDGVTGKAVSGYFERVKKEPHWDRTKSTADKTIDGNPKTGTPKTPTPRKPRTPKGKKGAAAQDDGDDEEPQEFDTPSKKKTPIHKTKGGRVTKSRGKQQNYVGQDMDEDDEDAEDEGRMVKMEDAPVSSNGDFENGNGYEDNGYENQYAVTGADQHENFYNAAEDYGDA